MFESQDSCDSIIFHVGACPQGHTETTRFCWRKGTLTVPFHTILPVFSRPPQRAEHPRTPSAGRGRGTPGGDVGRRTRQRPSAVGHDRRDTATTGAALTGASPKRSRDFHRQDEAPPPPSPRFSPGAAARDASQASPASLARRRARPSGGRDAGDSIARRLGGASARPPHQKNQTGRRGGAAAPQLLMRDASSIPATANEKKGEGQPFTLPTGTILPPVRRSSRRHI